MSNAGCFFTQKKTTNTSEGKWKVQGDHISVSMPEEEQELNTVPSQLISHLSPRKTIYHNG